MTLIDNNKAAPARKKTVAAKRPLTPTPKRVRSKIRTVVIDGVSITLRQPVGKGVLKRAEIVKAVKKVVAPRKLAEGTGAKNAAEK
jgi:hypothetical protein